MLNIYTKKFKVGTLDNLIFSDKKLFTVEAIFKSQNNRVLSKSKHTIPKVLKKTTRTQKSAFLMVWAAVSPNRRSSYFLKPMKSKSIVLST